MKFTTLHYVGMGDQAKALHPSHQQFILLHHWARHLNGASLQEIVRKATGDHQGSLMKCWRFPAISISFRRDGGWHTSLGESYYWNWARLCQEVLLGLTRLSLTYPSKRKCEKGERTNKGGLRRGKGGLSLVTFPQNSASNLLPICVQLLKKLAQT